MVAKHVGWTATSAGARDRREGQTEAAQQQHPEQVRLYPRGGTGRWQREPIQLLDRSETSARLSHCPPICGECASRGVPVRHVTMLRAANRVSLCSQFELVGFPQDWDRACHEGGSKPSMPTNRLRALLAADRKGESQPSSKGNHNAVGHFRMPLVDHGERSPPNWPRKLNLGSGRRCATPNPPRTKGASLHAFLPDRTVQGGPPGWCSNIATNHGHVLLRICAPSPVSQPARGMWHGHSHKTTREPMPTARPEVWGSAPAEFHGTGKFWPNAPPQIHHGQVGCPTP